MFSATTTPDASSAFSQEDGNTKFRQNDLLGAMREYTKALALFRWFGAWRRHTLVAPPTNCHADRSPLRPKKQQKRPAEWRRSVARVFTVSAERIPVEGGDEQLPYRKAELSFEGAERTQVERLIVTALVNIAQARVRGGARSCACAAASRTDAYRLRRVCRRVDLKRTV